MLRRFGILAALLLLSCSGEGRQSEPIALVRNVHALFVGIDAYQFSRSKLPGAQFKDLQGAVGDAQRFKQALAALYGVDVDKASGEACESANDHTVTLINDCATRSRILTALDNKIAALKPGDTLLFYFAGHGAQYRDDEKFDQDSGYNGTILPYDARNPDGSPGDIFDVELKAIKERAVAKGLYFVTIFDSCNSGTATRNGAIGQSRSVPVLEQAAPVEQTPPAPESPVAE
ncbi:MAG: caspase family protein, partial [Erythrobacteraceae bacterium]